MRATNTRNNNDLSSRALTSEEICTKIAELFVTQNEYGDIIIAGVPEVDSILDSRKFCKAVVSFVEALRHSDAYTALGAISYIASWAEVNNLVDWLCEVKPKACEWLNAINWEGVIFEDYLLNKIWQTKFNKKAAVLLYGLASFLTDSRFDLRMHNYNGDIASTSVITENASLLFKEEWELE